ncbi:MAG: nicotinate-nucleotide adenylyltransferase [Eubacterium sp.]|nr:nicotinate-nucleotide adenylyltransferase [Eubacterium sp.]
MQKRVRRIGLMGGTFNPIHYGHLLIAENAYEQYHLDEVIFIPTGQSPHKDARQILRADERMEMIRLAIADNPHFSCSDYEIRTEGISYTYLTVQAFYEPAEERELFFIMGADSLAYFDAWMRPDKISRMSTILAAVRDGLNMEELLPIRESLQQKYGTKIGFINTPNFSVSSRMIRHRMEKGHSIRYLVPEAVERYLKEHRVYVQ